jgi:hypothetical protein
MAGCHYTPIVYFIHSFSMKEKLIRVIDGMTKKILRNSKGKRY